MSKHEMTSVEDARKLCDVYKVHAPTLDKNMRPAFRLLNVQCKRGLNGECNKCDFFIGAFSEDGTFSSSGSYEGFCQKKENEISL